MTQCHTLNVKLSNLKLNKLKSEIKIGTEVTSNLSSNAIDGSKDETKFPHKLLLTDTQVSRPRKAFANSSPANIKFSKTQLSKMIQLGGFYFVSFSLSPVKTVNGSTFHGLSKIQDLARKVSNEKLNKILDVANIFRKMSKEEFNKSFTGSGIMLKI